MKYLRSSFVVARDVAGEHLLVPVSGEVADMRRLFSLNDSGMMVWTALANSITEEQLVEIVLQKYKAEEGVVRQDVHELLGQLVEQKLVQSIP